MSRFFSSIGWLKRWLWRVVSCCFLLAGVSLFVFLPLVVELSTCATKVVTSISTVFVAIALSTLINTPFKRWLCNRIIDVCVELDDLTEDEGKKKKERDLATEWLALTMGTLEVATYTILIAVGGPVGVAFFPAWLALKMAAGWGTRDPGDVFARRMSMRALILNLVNLIIAAGAAGFIRWTWGLSLTG
jgi:hypothetical protein